MLFYIEEPKDNTPGDYSAPLSLPMPPKRTLKGSMGDGRFQRYAHRVSAVRQMFPKASKCSEVTARTFHRDPKLLFAMGKRV